MLQRLDWCCYHVSKFRNVGNFTSRRGVAYHKICCSAARQWESNISRMEDIWDFQEFRIHECVYFILGTLSTTKPAWPQCICTQRL